MIKDILKVFNGLLNNLSVLLLIKFILMADIERYMLLSIV